MTDWRNYETQCVALSIEYDQDSFEFWARACQSLEERGFDVCKVQLDKGTKGILRRSQPIT